MEGGFKKESRVMENNQNTCLLLQTKSTRKHEENGKTQKCGKINVNVIKAYVSLYLFQFVIFDQRFSSITFRMIFRLNHKSFLLKMIKARYVCSNLFV